MAPLRAVLGLELGVGGWGSAEEEEEEEEEKGLELCCVIEGDGRKITDHQW